ncbi:hypothetical protein PIB30_019374 [Stylosanthes scabra]|uniref:Uncharacterized protein n=1 Tax=Stylosanthes scabra TaxID=79078 RepID=A0ABU6Y6G6_9FABA|nr:hypothetical protein [Stylosanthes scabra]
MEHAAIVSKENRSMIQGKRTTRISVKPVRHRYSQRIIARPKPKKVEVINLSNDDEAEVKGKETTVEQPILVANQEEPKEEEEDPEYEEEKEEEDPEESVEPEEIPTSWSLLSLSTSASKGGDDKYDDAHYWNFDGDLDQWDTGFSAN